MNFKISSTSKMICINQDTGKSFELDNVQDMTLTTTIEESCNNYIQPINRKPKAITFSVENAQWNLNNIDVRRLLNLPVSNNWRKMHGYPMQQRKR